MADPRAHVLKLRLSPDELEAVRARACAEPVAAWLRRLALDGAPPPKSRRRAPEAAVSPEQAERTRAVVLAGNQLRQIVIALEAADASDLALVPIEAALARIETQLHQALEPPC